MLANQFVEIIGQVEWFGQGLLQVQTNKRGISRREEILVAEFLRCRGGDGDHPPTMELSQKIYSMVACFPRAYPVIVVLVFVLSRGLLLDWLQMEGVCLLFAQQKAVSKYMAHLFVNLLLIGLSIDFGEAVVASTLFMEKAEACKLSEPSNVLFLPLRKGSCKQKKARNSIKNFDDIQTTKDHLLHMKQKQDNKTVKKSCIHRMNLSLTAALEETNFPCSSFQEGSYIEVLRQYNLQRVWLPGIVERVMDGKAVISFREINGGMLERYESVQIRVVFGGFLEKDSDEYASSSCPAVRPSMSMGTLPEEIKSTVFDYMQKTLTGQPVEVWTNDRWVEGVLTGFTDDGLLLKFQDASMAMVNATSVRLAPIWLAEKKSWRLTTVKIDQAGSMSPDNQVNNTPRQIVPFVQSTSKTRKKPSQIHPLEQIPANQYCARSAMVSSLVVSWSPLLHFPAERSPISPTGSSKCISVLAVGGKSGLLSLWKMQGPDSYSLERKGTSTAVLVGLIQAHDTWITAIAWAPFACEVPTDQVLIATGSSHGSVKMWRTSCAELLESRIANSSPFSLLNEISSGGSGLVSVLTMTVPGRYLDRVLLAIGRGSGSLEVWSVDVFSRNCYRVSFIDAHNHVVTGLAWAFDGNYLYSTSQDNSLRCWILLTSSLLEISIPSNALGKRNPIDVPDAGNSCFGVAISPGNLAIAVARGFDVELLHPMYQARTIKGAVGFIWAGGQDLPQPDLNKALPYKKSALWTESLPGLSHTGLMKWECDILRALSKYEDGDRPIVLWDVMAALLAFKHHAPNFVEQMILNWMDLHSEATLSHICKLFTKIHSRKLQILNVICRRVLLPEPEAGNKTILWGELLQNCERVLRERLVYVSILIASRIECGHPMGISQMKWWTKHNFEHVHEELKLLVREYDYGAEERCSYCSCPVPFDSPEVAHCSGGHKLQRCSASMMVCPTSPLWFCMCCQRSASILPPSLCFEIMEFPTGNLPPIQPGPSFKPWCPFCGIPLQRIQPDFLLSTSPV